MRPLEGVRNLRELRMLTQQELADKAGVSLFTVQRIERGDGNVRPKTGRSIADALGVHVEELLGKAQAPIGSIEWKRAVEDARAFREPAALRMRDLLSEWEASKDRQVDAGERRALRTEMGRLLQDAYDATSALTGELTDRDLADQWHEVRAADRFYGELCGMVRGHGLHVYPLRPEDQQEEHRVESVALAS